MKNVTLSNEMIKNLSVEDYYNQENFIKDCKTYIKALKSGRLQYKVTNVSKSGMSRDILISSYEGTMLKGYYRNYSMLLKILGYNFVNKYSNEIKVKGCGMDMLFNTNYNIIHTFKSMGLINKKECDILSQKI